MIVGLTGGIGSGKSSAATKFSELGITVVDADQVAREVVQPGSLALGKISRHFGENILTSQGELDRTKLRAVIFNNHDEKAWLEALLHPIIRELMFQKLNASSSVYSILEAPLLFENGLDSYCDRSILVDLPVDLQIERASIRDQVSKEQIMSIINSQLPREKKKEKADYILENSGDLEALYNQVLRLDQVLRLLADTKEFL